MKEVKRRGGDTPLMRWKSISVTPFLSHVSFFASSSSSWNSTPSFRKVLWLRPQHPHPDSLLRLPHYLGDLAMRKTMPPLLAGWTPNLLFSALGIYLFVKAANESPSKPIVWLTEALDSFSRSGKGLLKMFESHRVLHRYIMREYLKIFSLSLSSLILIYIVVIFFQKMNFFQRHNAPFYLMFEYVLYKIPEATFQWTISLRGSPHHPSHPRHTLSPQRDHRL